MNEFEQDEFERELTRALQRVDAPEGLAVRIMERAAGPAAAKIVPIRRWPVVQQRWLAEPWLRRWRWASSPVSSCIGGISKSWPTSSSTRRAHHRTMRWTRRAHSYCAPDSDSAVALSRILK